MAKNPSGMDEILRRWRDEIKRKQRRIEFQTWADWREQQKLLKVRFFTPIRSRTATYDIAYGNIERSAYRNHPYD